MLEYKYLHIGILVFIEYHDGNAESKGMNILIASLKSLFQKIAIPLSFSWS